MRKILRRTFWKFLKVSGCYPDTTCSLPIQTSKIFPIMVSTGNYDVIIIIRVLEYSHKHHNPTSWWIRLIFDPRFKSVIVIAVCKSSLICQWAHGDGQNETCGCMFNGRQWRKRLDTLSGNRLVENDSIQEWRLRVDRHREQVRSARQCHGAIVGRALVSVDQLTCPNTPIFGMFPMQ